VHVVNPYANQLTFLSDKTRMRRDHMKYLTLIRSIALLHQHQRPVQSITHHGQALVYIEVTKSDIELANRLAHEILGRTLDELPPQTRSLLRLMHAMVKDMAKTQNIPAREVRFTRRDVREATRWSDNQLKVHCTRLSEMEYLLTHGGTRGHYLQYELLYDGQDDGAAHLMGLIDSAELDNDARKLGKEERKLPLSWPQVAPKLVPSWSAQNADSPATTEKPRKTAQNARSVKTGPASSLAAAVV